MVTIGEVIKRIKFEIEEGRVVNNIKEEYNSKTQGD